MADFKRWAHIRGFGHLKVKRKIDPLQLVLEGIGFFDAAMPALIISVQHAQVTYLPALNAIGFIACRNNDSIPLPHRSGESGSRMITVYRGKGRTIAAA